VPQKSRPGKTCGTISAVGASYCQPPAFPRRLDLFDFAFAGELRLVVRREQVEQAVDHHEDLLRRRFLPHCESRGDCLPFLAGSESGAVMVLSVGQCILPAFVGMRLLWSTGLMFEGLALLATGCTLRVSGEVLAYQGYADWAWSVLPLSAVLELAGITCFAANILGTFVLEPSRAQNKR